MASLTMKYLNNFEVLNKTTISIGENVVGYIQPDSNHKTIIINSQKYFVYNVEYFLPKDKEIYVRQMGMDDSNKTDVNKLEKYNTFYEKAKFNLFYDNQNNILIVDISSDIARKFLKDLENSNFNNKSKLDMKKFSFNYKKLCIDSYTVTSMSFSVKDNTDVKNKRFSGNRVANDNEAMNAINEDNVKYMICRIDISGKLRTIGFSVSGAIVVYGKLKDLYTKEYPYLELIIKFIYNKDYLK